MAYTNPADITGILATDYITRNSTGLAKIQTIVDLEILAEVCRCGLGETDIAVDIDGFTTVSVLQLFGHYRLLYHIMDAQEGGTQQTDIYKKKRDDYAKESRLAADKITAETIKSYTEPTAAGRITATPVW